MWSARVATAELLPAWVSWARAHPAALDGALVDRLATRIARGPDAGVGAFEGDELRVYADPTRCLPVADPDGRQLVMGCGAAMVNLRFAAAHFGHATSLEILPGHRRDGLLARVRLEERSASTPEAEPTGMFGSMPPCQSAVRPCRSGVLTARRTRSS